MIARVLTLDCVNYIFKDMEKRRISREEKENLRQNENVYLTE
jgi:hypothetical protein